NKKLAHFFGGVLSFWRTTEPRRIMTTPTRERKTLMGYPVLSIHHGTRWMLSLDESTTLEADGSWDKAQPELERQLREYLNEELVRIEADEEEGKKRCGGKCSCGKASRKRENAPGGVLISDTGDVSSFERQATEGQILSGEMLFNYLE